MDDTALKLAGDVQRHEAGVEVRLVDLLDLHLDLLAGHFLEALAQLLHALALAPDDDAGLGGEQRDLDLVGVALDLNPGDTGPFRLFFDEAADLEVFLKQLAVTVTLSKPTSGPVAIDLQPEPYRMNLPSH